MSALPNASLGPFDLLERLGRGASGEVWRALEHRTGRVVAVKVLTGEAGRDDQERTEHLAWRFQREVEAAAQQDHPHIARIFSSGVSGGRPWYSMELIDGLPIDAHTAEHQLDLRARLGLLLAVCAGVQHAHDRGVIHRDLKPANILVRADGMPKILDFGLARFLEDGALGSTLSQDGQSLGTPMFMAPEQARGHSREVGVAADVYALGVILYHLATDAWPFDETLPPLQLLSAVCESEPRPARAINPQLPRDLAAIITKAMASAVADRYLSVRALAEDLNRFLAAEPVAARAWTPGYLVRKSLRKHWRGVALSCGVLTLAAVLIIARLHEKQRAAARQARALEQARELVNSAVFDLQGQLESLGRPELLTRVVERMNALAGDATAEDHGPLDLRRYRALASSIRGEMLAQKHDLNGALMAYTSAANAYEVLVQAQPERDDLRREAAEAHLATTHLAMETRRSLEALNAARKAQAVLAPTRERLPLALAAAERQLARVLAYRGSLNESDAAIERGLQHCRAQSPRQDTAHLEPDLHLLRGLNLAQRNLAAESHRSIVAAEQLYRTRLSTWPGKPDLLEGFARALGLLAADAFAEGKLAETRRLADEALAMHTEHRAIRKTDFWSGYDAAIGAVYADLARVFFARSEWAAGLDAAATGVSLFEEHVAENKTLYRRRIPLASLYRDVAYAHLQLGDRTSAANAWQSAFAHTRQITRREDQEPRWQLDVIEANLELLDLPQPTHGADTLASRPRIISRATSNLNTLHRRSPLSHEDESRAIRLNERFKAWDAKRKSADQVARTASP